VEVMDMQPDSDVNDEIPVDVARLRNTIACELHAQLGMRNEAIEFEDITEVAYAVAVRLRHAFRIEWAPDWGNEDEDDEDQALSLDATVVRFRRS